MSYRQLMNDIKNNELKRLYLLYGEEAYLLDRGWDSLKKAVVTQFPELNYTQLEGEGLKAGELSAACETFPFACERRLVAVRDLYQLRSAGKSDGGENAASGRDLQAFADVVANVPGTTCLLFLCYGSVDKRRKLFNEIKKQGAVYEFNRADRDDLGTWIRNSLSKGGKKIGPRELDYLILLSGYLDKNGSRTLYDVENLLQKLVSYMGGAVNVEASHIDAIAPRNIENDIFKLINACSERNISESLRIYGDLLLEGESSLGILALLTKQVRNMVAIWELRKLGMDGRTIAERLKIHEYTAKLCIKYGASIKYPGLQAAFKRCLETEMRIKSGQMGERLAMELLLTELFPQK